MSRDQTSAQHRAANADDAWLAVEGLSKSYGALVALDDISFEVRRGEFVALLGPSGAGKSTLFRCIAGLLRPDRGRITLNGVDVATIARRERRRLAVVFQQFNLVARLTALDNVLAGRLAFTPTWRGVLRRFGRDDRLLALACLERVGLLAHATQRADRLSGGQQQRVAIARALAQQADVIIADEPIASLDPRSSEEILELLRMISRHDNVAVICSLHQTEFARRFATRIVGIARGRLVSDGGADDFGAVQTARIYSRAAAP